MRTTASVAPGCILTDLVSPSALLEGDAVKELLELLAVFLTGPFESKMLAG